MFLRMLLVLGLLLSLPALASDCKVVSRLSLDTVVEFRPKDNRLKIIANEQPLHTILIAVTRETGIEFLGEAGQCDRVTVETGFLDLNAALSRLLSGISYVLREDAVQQTTQVWLLPNSNADAPTEAQIMRDEFYRGLQATPDSEKLAEQIRRLEK